MRFATNAPTASIGRSQGIPEAEDRIFTFSMSQTLCPLGISATSCGRLSVLSPAGAFSSALTPSVQAITAFFLGFDNGFAEVPVKGDQFSVN